MISVAPRRAARTSRLVPVDPPGQRLYGHDGIVARAVADLRERYRDKPDPDGLLGDEFTLLDLRRVHEQVRDSLLQPDTFRRAMMPFLEPTGAMTVARRGRPAELFRHNGR